MNEIKKQTDTQTAEDLRDDVTKRRESMAEKADDTRVREALELLNSVAKDKKTELQSMVQNKYGDLKSVIGSWGDKIQHDATEIYQKGREKTVSMASDLDKNVHQSPWSFIGGAALGALIIGYLMGRSNK